MQVFEFAIIRLVCEVVNVYVIRSLIQQFLSKDKYSKVIEIISYITYYVLSILIYFLIHIPIAILIFNLLAFVIISLNYKASIKQRLVAVIFTYCILFLIEMLIVALSGYLQFSIGAKFRYSSIWGEIANQIVGVVVVLLIKMKNRKIKYSVMPNSYWLSIISVPILSLCYLVFLFQVGELEKTTLIFNVIFLIVVNLTNIMFYDVVIESIFSKTEKLLLAQQIESYEKQLSIMKTAFKSNQSIQHDLKDHLFSIRTYIKENNNRNAINYIDKMEKMNWGYEQEFLKSGNSIIDSILNFKCHDARERKINISLTVQIPEDLNLDAFDTTIILGNILDNAIDAASKVTENKKIKFFLSYDRGRLIIDVKNTYTGEILTKKDGLLTTKKEELFHGIGIENVKRTVEKYNGILEYSYDEEWFKMFILIYI